MAVLVKGDWPVLKQIQLSFNPTLIAVAVAYLSKADWSLQAFEMSHMPINATELAHLQLCNLHAIAIFLDNTVLTTEAVSDLPQADWPILRHLDLSRNDLDAAAMLYMCMVRVPALRVLVLNNATLHKRRRTGLLNTPDLC